MPEVIDFHCHILPPDFAVRHEELARRDATYATLFPQAGGRIVTAETLLEDMSGAGVDHSVALGFGWTDLEVAREVNDYLIWAAGHYPSQITGFCSVNPAWGDTALVEVERCAARGLKGVGELHPDSQGFDLTDADVMAPLMELARQLELLTLVHSSEPVGHLYPGKGRTTPERVYQFARNFPDNKIICAHWGGGLAFYGLMPELADELRNVYFDTAASPFLYRKEVFPVAARTIGPEKILFGTDYPLLAHRRVLAQITDSEMAAEVQAAILGGNAATLLGRDAGL